MNRTGIKPDEKAIQLYEDGTALKGIRMMGLHAYDGHIRNKEVKERARACNADFAPVLMMRKTLMEKGYVEPRLIAGGTPTFPVYAAYSHVECSPGTFIYWDKGYQDACPEQKFLPAALVITRVVSLPGETTLCVDMGYKSIASENEPANRVYFLNAPGLTVVSQSEEHMVLEAGKQHAWKIGDLLYGLPVHICPSCALYDAAITVEKGDVTGAWEIISRKRKITI
jgi:D-serine deaminase-like pyridoxal phosphate-dependent protein